MTAHDYVAGIDLSGTKRSIIEQDAAVDIAKPFDQAKEQSQVVGSSVFSFATGVDTNIRQAISNSALLAQLVANKQTSSETDPLAWFQAYTTVLQNVGWVIQESGYTDYDAAGTQVEVNEEIMTVMSVVLGPAPAALAIVASAVAALKGMQPGSPWLTLFSRESQKANVARFQIGLVDTDANGETFVAMGSCLIESAQEITQVLFFKWKQAKARFRANTAKVSLNSTSLTDLNDAIVKKTQAFQRDYVSSIVDL